MPRRKVKRRRKASVSRPRDRMGRYKKTGRNPSGRVLKRRKKVSWGARKVKRRATGLTAAARRRRAKKAAATRAAKAKARSEAAKKAARTRKRRAAARKRAAPKRRVVRRKTTTRKRVTRKRTRKTTTRKRVATNPRSKSMPKRKRRVRRRRRKVSRNPKKKVGFAAMSVAKRRAIARKGGKAAHRKRRRRNPAPKRTKRGTFRKKGRYLKSRGRKVTFLSKSRRRGKRKRYAVKRSTRRLKRGGTGYRHRVVRANPVKAIGQTLVKTAGTFAGMVGARVLANAININVITKYYSTWAATSTGKVLAPIIPSAGALLVGAVLHKFAKKPKFTQPLLDGAALNLMDQVLKGILAAAGSTTASAYLGMGDPYGEYVAEPMGHPGMDEFDVEEALAEYVSDPSAMGLEVDEALADDEVEAFQTGYAGGTLYGSVFRQG